jgi:hypothetical protein
MEIIFIWVLTIFLLITGLLLLVASVMELEVVPGMIGLLFMVLSILIIKDIIVL